jgi:phospholipid-transporting ATPase
MQMFKSITISDGQPTIAVPLAFVIIVSMFKDLIEDRKRQNSDNEENSKKVKKWTGNNYVTVEWHTVVSGDILMIENETSFPADLLLLHTTNPKKDCFIMTKNLDGETNLKKREV